MERDFMGLKSNELSDLVEEGHTDHCGEIGHARFTSGTEMQLVMPEDATEVPPMMSLADAHEDKMKKRSEPQLSSGFNPYSIADLFNSHKKCSTTDAPNPLNQSRQRGMCIGASIDLHEARSMHSHDRNALLPVSNHDISFSPTSHFFKNHRHPIAGHNEDAYAISQQILGGLPVTVPLSSNLPIGGCVPGTMNTCTKSSCKSSPQLTIFYAGSVSVYEDISPEKAQAIMFLAGNGATISSNTRCPNIELQAPKLSRTVTDTIPSSQLVNNRPSSCSALPLPSPSSHSTLPRPAANPGTGAGETTSAVATAAAAAGSMRESPKLSSSARSFPAAVILPSGVPQARKASLARFLEKRRERVMSVAPYGAGKNSSEPNSPESSIMNFSTLAGTTTSISASKEIESVE